MGKGLALLQGGLSPSFHFGLEPSLVLYIRSQMADGAELSSSYPPHF